ncbi:MAG TPA: hypothetical protein VFZ97_13060 [Acidimicrobiales bacterium]
MITDPTWSAAVPGASFLYCWLIAGIAFKNGSRVAGRLEFVSLVLAAVAIFAWQITSSPSVAILLAIVADSLACVAMILRPTGTPSRRSRFPS